MKLTTQQRAINDTNEHIELVKETVPYTRISDMLLTIAQRHDEYLSETHDVMARHYAITARNYLRQQARLYA